jgi:L-threonylcarbamoyladenylate synthase
MDELIRAGKIFIYPTDTIYGIGCDATNEEAVRKIRAIKNRPEEKSFLVVPPSREWIVENIDINDPEKLASGPFAYFVFPKNQKCVAESVRDKDECALGLRMSANWFSKEIEKAGVPFVSTSVNISGNPHMTSLEDLDPAIRDAVDIIVYEGPKMAKQSTKIDFTK